MKIVKIISNYAISHIRNCISCLGSLYRSPWNSTLTIIVVGIALTLPTSFISLLLNAQKLVPHWDNTAQLSVFFKHNQSPTLTNNQVEQITNLSYVKKYKLLSPTDALHEFEQITGQANILDYLGENPLPSVLVITIEPTTPNKEIINLQSQLEQWPAVEEVKLDHIWLQRLTAIINLGKYFIIALASILALAVVLIIGNTTRLNIENKKKNIIVAKLVGATDSFIRREFLYLGFWYGLFGAIISWLIISTILYILQIPVSQLAKLYETSFSLLHLSIGQICLLLSSGLILGVSGAWLAVNRHLHEIETSYP